MKQIKPMTEEFMYCDPECICDNDSPTDESHPCHLCYVADKLAETDAEIVELRYE